VTRVTGSGARPDEQPAPDGAPVVVPLPIAVDVTNTTPLRHMLVLLDVDHLLPVYASVE